MRNLLISDFDLQRFADGGEPQGQESGDNKPKADQEQGQNQGQGQDQNQGQEEQGEGDKTFTQEEMDKILGARLARQKEQMMTEFTKKLEEALDEQERLSKMTESERKKAEEEARDKELEETKEELRLLKLENETTLILEDKGLPQTFRPFLMGADLDKTKENVEAFEKVYKEEVKKASEERWRSKPPRDSRGGQTEEEQAWTKALEKYKK